MLSNFSNNKTINISSGSVRFKKKEKRKEKEEEANNRSILSWHVVSEVVLGDIKKLALASIIGDSTWEGVL